MDTQRAIRVAPTARRWAISIYACASPVSWPNVQIRSVAIQIKRLLDQHRPRRPRQQLITRARLATMGVIVSRRRVCQWGTSTSANAWMVSPSCQEMQLAVIFHLVICRHRRLSPQPMQPINALMACTVVIPCRLIVVQTGTDSSVNASLALSKTTVTLPTAAKRQRLLLTPRKSLVTHRPRRILRCHQRQHLHRRRRAHLQKHPQ